MARNIHRLAGVLALVMITQAHALAPARRFSPRWDVGTTWTVQTEYRQTQVADGAAWSAPVAFRYTVTDRKQDGDRTVTTIEARPEAARTSFATRITVVEQQGHLAVASVDTQHRRQGKLVTEHVDGSMGPVFTESSIIPYDAPLFPLEKASDLVGSSMLTVKRKFQTVQSAGGSRFAHSRSQLVKGGNVSSYLDARGGTVDFRVPAEPARVFPVEMADETTGQRVVQYWAEGQPWFLFSENDSSRSWLVKP